MHSGSTGEDTCHRVGQVPRHRHAGPLHPHRAIVSKTDLQGNITNANNVFVAVSGYITDVGGRRMSTLVAKTAVRAGAAPSAAA